MLWCFPLTLLQSLDWFWNRTLTPLKCLETIHWMLFSEAMSMLLSTTGPKPRNKIFFLDLKLIKIRSIFYWMCPTIMISSLELCEVPKNDNIIFHDRGNDIPYHKITCIPSLNCITMVVTIPWNDLHSVIKIIISMFNIFVVILMLFHQSRFNAWLIQSQVVKFKSFPNFHAPTQSLVGLHKMKNKRGWAQDIFCVMCMLFMTYKALDENDSWPL